MIDLYAIELLTRNYTGDRLTNAVVRVGLHPDISRNAMCGTPVNRSEAVSGALVVKECNPPEPARYVSVDIEYGAEIGALSLCEVMVEGYSADNYYLEQGQFRSLHN